MIQQITKYRYVHQCGVTASVEVNQVQCSLGNTIEWEKVVEIKTKKKKEVIRKVL